MVYDTTLETVAQNFADANAGGFTAHNANRDAEYAALGGSGSVGENWYSATPADATEKWTTYLWSGCSEQQNWWKQVQPSSAQASNYPSCTTGATGHYTQVM